MEHAPGRPVAVGSAGVSEDRSVVEPLAGDGGISLMQKAVK